MRMTVIGTGYLGAVHAACMADLGHDVLGVDVDEAKLAALAAGRTPFYEPGLPEILARTVASGNLRFSTSLEEAADFGEVHFLCVGTPQQPGSAAADMRPIDSVIEGLAPHLRDDCLVVGKSTVPVGTSDRLAARIAELAPVGARAEVAWNPEFLSESTAVEDTLRPDRIVVGVTSHRAEAVLGAVYSTMRESGTPYLVTDRTTAELVKVSANAFLATKVSFVNAMAEVCEATGGDVTTLAKAIGYDPRIGHRFLAAGVGFGGGCLPKDIRAFSARADELGFGDSLRFLRDVDEINMRARQRTVDRARTMLDGRFLGRRVAVLGAAFKSGSDDVRDSPALAVAASIQLQGAHVRVHDPEALDNARAAFPCLDYAREPEKACEGADLVLHLTDWAEYRDLNPAELAGVVDVPRLLDARNTLDLEHWRTHGWDVGALGRGNLAA
ncbi:UDP-glucose/GDP-mannose dehydrogenase family protein [Actinomycetospora endophytica]|uniref:UDP-glucose 6-dehydrogenase n=1 Tax=Actinomycetospora endophytica TaxID=2291215 RepID=A0ABS8PGS2_9PSEU|nr:UDP-glucose/GDP-mannose dehydrogenase family protein [Actinomycetospora endophytica]MCD2196194.1 UDP-glucose/GDP-mannose dehydrogenase family protein [Actinomycetospora endophytica]